LVSSYSGGNALESLPGLPSPSRPSSYIRLGAKNNPIKRGDHGRKGRFKNIFLSLMKIKLRAATPP
jgi:hypothetical protein